MQESELERRKYKKGREEDREPTAKERKGQGWSKRSGREVKG
jgi:hypothetical protein